MSIRLFAERTFISEREYTGFPNYSLQVELLSATKRRYVLDTQGKRNSFRAGSGSGHRDRLNTSFLVFPFFFTLEISYKSYKNHIEDVIVIE